MILLRKARCRCKQLGENWFRCCLTSVIGGFDKAVLRGPLVDLQSVPRVEMNPAIVQKCCLSRAVPFSIVKLVAIEKYSKPIVVCVVLRGVNSRAYLYQNFVFSQPSFIVNTFITSACH